MILFCGVLVGSMCLCVSMAERAADIPSSCGMFVYSELTSAVTRYVSCERGGCVSMSCSRCLVSFRYVGNVSAMGWKIVVRYLEILSVGESTPLMMGRGGLPCL